MSPNCSRRRKRAEGPSSGSSQKLAMRKCLVGESTCLPILREETTTLLTSVVTSADTPWFSHGFFFPKSRVWWLLGLKVPGRLTFLREAALSHLVLHRLQVTKGCHEVFSRTCHAFDVLYSFRTRACPHQAGPVTGETWRKVRGKKSWTHHSLLSNCPELDEGVMCVLFHGVIQIIINHGPSKHGLLWELQMAVALFGLATEEAVGKSFNEDPDELSVSSWTTTVNFKFLIIVMILELVAA